MKMEIGLGSIKMKSCIQCGDIFKYDRKGIKSKEHYERFHVPPQLNKDDTITLNASHQVCLIVKGNESWQKYFKKLRKHDNSWLRDGKILQKFEQDNSIEFQYCRSNEELSYSQIEISFWQRVKNWFEK